MNWEEQEAKVIVHGVLIPLTLSVLAGNRIFQQFDFQIYLVPIFSRNTQLQFGYKRRGTTLFLNKYTRRINDFSTLMSVSSIQYSLAYILSHFHLHFNLRLNLHFIFNLSVDVMNILLAFSQELLGWDNKCNGKFISYSFTIHNFLRFTYLQSVVWMQWGEYARTQILSWRWIYFYDKESCNASPACWVRSKYTCAISPVIEMQLSVSACHSMNARNTIPIHGWVTGFFQSAWGAWKR